MVRRWQGSLHNWRQRLERGKTGRTSQVPSASTPLRWSKCTRVVFSRCVHIFVCFVIQETRCVKMEKKTRKQVQSEILCTYLYLCLWKNSFCSIYHLRSLKQRSSKTICLHASGVWPWGIPTRCSQWVSCGASYVEASTWENISGLSWVLGSIVRDRRQLMLPSLEPIEATR